MDILDLYFLWVLLVALLLEFHSRASMQEVVFQLHRTIKLTAVLTLIKLISA